MPKLSAKIKAKVSESRAMAFNPRDKLQGGKYTIVKELGRSRFGITYLARDRNGNNHAIKTLNEDTLDDPADFEQWQQNFVQEGMKLLDCRHPHIVRAEEIFQEGRLWCIVMEYVEGVNLSERSWGVFPERKALIYIKQIGEALIAAHDRGFIHGNVKPENIVRRTDKPEVVLIGFGISREFDHPLIKNYSHDLIESFAPPELYLRNAKQGPFTDIYSLASTLYLLLTGQRPETAKERQYDEVLLTPPKELNPEISDRSNLAILRGMALAPCDRPQTMREWLDLLGLIRVPPPAPPPTTDSSAQSDSTKTWRWPAVLMVGVIVSVGLVSIPVWMPLLQDFLQSIQKPTTNPKAPKFPGENTSPGKK